MALDEIPIENEEYSDKIVHVPSEFKPHIHFDYPKDNSLMFEEWFYKKYLRCIDSISTDYIYLPVFWTSYYVNNDYGNNKVSLNRLQVFIDSLDKKKKYFTIVQYDDGILNDIKGLDIKVFGMSKLSQSNINLPLLCQPHNIQSDVNKTIFASFLGKNTHLIRKQMIDELKNNPLYDMSLEPKEFDVFIELLSKSVFSLCPRGYGQNSFRISEALEVGSIPVYISNIHVLPKTGSIDFSDYGIVIHADKIHLLKNILENIPMPKILNMQKKGKEVYEKYYTFEGAFANIVLPNIKK
jgi:hypothetical protein